MRDVVSRIASTVAGVHRRTAVVGHRMAVAAVHQIAGVDEHPYLETV